MHSFFPYDEPWNNCELAQQKQTQSPPNVQFFLQELRVIVSSSIPHYSCNYLLGLWDTLYGCHHSSSESTILFVEGANRKWAIVKDEDGNAGWNERDLFLCSEPFQRCSNCNTLGSTFPCGSLCPSRGFDAIAPPPLESQSHINLVVHVAPKKDEKFVKLATDPYL